MTETTTRQREPAARALRRLRERVDQELAGFLAAELADAPAGAADAVRYAALAPGKRIRPLLLLGAYRAGGAAISPGAVRLACSVELVHAYSLIHDDLPCMDDDVMRRGRAALHVRFGVRPAVLAGAVLMPLAVRAILDGGRSLELPDHTTARLAGLLSHAAGAAGMVGGQLLDLEAEGRRPERDELERIYRGKTGALLTACARMGGVAAGAGPTALARLDGFGRRLGLAFQIVDDVLDVTASERETGKPSGRDAALEKATYPGLFGLAAAEERSRELAAAAREEVRGLGDAGLLLALADYVVRRGR